MAGRIQRLVCCAAATSMILVACGGAPNPAVAPSDIEKCADSAAAAELTSPPNYGGSGRDRQPGAYQFSCRPNGPATMPFKLSGASLDLQPAPSRENMAAEAAIEITETVDWDNPVIELAAMAPELEPLPELADIVPEAAPAPGEALGRIIIPKAEVDWPVVEGVTPKDLRGGPGHIRGSALPGQVGNTVIAGHRTTNGAPFLNLDRLERSDLIWVESLTGTHTYEVVGTRVVLPTDTWIATQWRGSWLTLTTCTPRFSSSNRLVVFATLIDGPNAETIYARYGPTTEIDPANPEAEAGR